MQRFLQNFQVILSVSSACCSYLNLFESALFGPNFADATTGWRQYAEEDHWINWFLSLELIRNVKQGYHSSDFISKVCGTYSALNKSIRSFSDLTLISSYFKIIF